MATASDTQARNPASVQLESTVADASVPLQSGQLALPDHSISLRSTLRSESELPDHSLRSDQSVLPSSALPDHSVSLRSTLRSESELSDLALLFTKYGSDKDRNGYAQLYYTLFAPLRDQQLKFLEIGIGTMIPGVHSSMVGYALPAYHPGGSLRAWRDFLPRASIIGVDVQPDTQFEEERIQTYLANSTKQDEVRALLAKTGGDFDVIIDDGSHLDEDQLATLVNLYPSLKDGGIYIIEDIPPSSVISGAPGIVASLTGGAVFFAGLRNNLCVIRKTKLRSSRVNY